MAYTHTHTETVSTTSGSIGRPSSATGTARSGVSETVATGATNQQVHFAFPVTGLTSLVIYSTENVTLKINDSGTPDQTLSIQALEPLIWRSGGLLRLPDRPGGDDDVRHQQQRGDGHPGVRGALRRHPVTPGLNFFQRP